MKRQKLITYDQIINEIYDFLEKLYSKMLENKKVRNIITKFKEKFDVDYRNISEIKILDFIMWKLGNIKRKKR